MFFLLALIIYSIANELPFIGKDSSPWLSFFIAIIVSALGIFFLPDPAKVWVNTILVSYNAMAIAILFIIPFIIIALLSKRLYSKRKPSIISKLLWIIFLALIIGRYITAPADQITPAIKWMFFGIALAAALMASWERRLWIIMARQELKEAIAGAEATKLEEVTVKLDQLAEHINAGIAAGTPVNGLIQKFNRLVKHQNSIGGNYKEWGKS
jgi:hypothetical protein